MAVRPIKKVTRPGRQPRVKSRNLPKQNVDILIDAPNLGLADGYGQSARSIIRMLIEIGEEENLSVKILNRRNLCPAIDRTKDILEIQNHLIEKESVTSCNIFFRYALPDIIDIPYKISILLTMFESDRVPAGWIPILNQRDVVINPTEWGRSIFSRDTTTKVICIPLPLNPIYYRSRIASDIFIGKNDVFRYITVGNYFEPDRKRIYELIEAFGKDQRFSDSHLYVKTAWADKGNGRSRDIVSLAKLYKNVELDLKNLATEELYDLYRTSHCGLFPSKGEGYGLPQLELSMMGRPLILAENSSFTSLRNLITDASLVKCKPIPSNYSPQLISNTGNWAKCDLKEFMNAAYSEKEIWDHNRDKYISKMLKNNHSDKLRYNISHVSIKEKYRVLMLEQMENCK